VSLTAFLRALRPHQWTKNVFVLAALVFAAGEKDDAFSASAAVATLLACAAFCLVSSAVYLVNDVVDVEKDRLHPTKKRRPIAAGELSISAARVGAVASGALGLALGWWSAPGGGVAVVLVVYAVLNLAYSFRLKHVVLVDAFCIAAGFLLRVEAGGRAARVEISHWAYLCMLFLALFLALNKRRAEVMQLGEGVATTRVSLREYSVGFLDQMVGVLAACTIVCYTMYTVDTTTIVKFGEDLVWTVPFVVFGIGRYMVLVQSGRGGDSPARILLGGDPWFALNTLGWAATAAWVIFGR